MNKKTKNTQDCCSVEALIIVDDRGQMVLPKKVRDKAGIKSGDKLVVVTWGEGKSGCCISLVKADAFSETAEKMIRK